MDRMSRTGARGTGSACILYSLWQPCSAETPGQPPRTAAARELYRPLAANRISQSRVVS